MITVLIASFTLAAAAASVSANAISTSDLDIEWEVDVIITSGTGSIRCPATLLGNFHSSTIRKTQGALVGVITHAVYAEPCTARRETLPWHLTYQRFEGTLPNITVLWFLLVSSSVQFRSSGLTCEFTTTAEEPAAVGARLSERGSAPTILFDPELAIDVAGGFLCDLLGDVTLEGIGSYEGGEGDTNVFTLI
jgi:hypothetical protein